MMEPRLGATASFWPRKAAVRAREKAIACVLSVAETTAGGVQKIK